MSLVEAPLSAAKNMPKIHLAYGQTIKPFVRMTILMKQRFGFLPTVVVFPDGTGVVWDRETDAIVCRMLKENEAQPPMSETEKRELRREVNPDADEFASD